MGNHALLSASSSHRWLNCPPSARLCEGYDDKGSNGGTPKFSVSIDIETYSSIDLSKCGVYRYTEAPDFDILLFGYSVDGGPVQIVDLASGEKLPAEIIAALTDDAVIK